MSEYIMNVNDVAKYLGFSTKKVYQLVESNQIPASKIGRQYRFLKDVVDDWLRQKTITSSIDWSKRLDETLAKARRRVEAAGITEKDIPAIIKKVRSAKHAGN